ncbi:guanine deaminase [Nocardia sp. CDC159]|uniref:Guanine deaminase n=1 Tax=Nocardia pulmonis TaxID=2951408 RepID=A0A9X2IVN4_9NOCA|nr:MULTISPECIES: guanine deaminase [Nocardia]MCM6771985.1 guanine deaminase [Nocardia pulmonis]MCM6785357.1 guanine deaminase [Nocardia sp. CDC159]
MRPAVYRGTVLHFLSDPGVEGEPGSWEVFEDGALAVGGDGLVRWAGEWSRLPDALRGEVIDHRGRLIVPGFVDAHVHYSQYDAIAGFGAELPEWMRRYVFPAERRFERRAHADLIAELFLDTLLANGTTTAAVHPTVHPASVDAFGAAAVRRGMRMVCGKVLMDKRPEAPEFLCDSSVAEAERQTRELIDRWHHTGRLGYAITPRFVPSSTDAQLAMAAELVGEYPDLLLQTHAAENIPETESVLARFPTARSYVDVYDRLGMLGPGTLLAHCVHIDDRDRARLAATGTAIAFCPTSNLFLGSGLFDLAAARRAGVRVGLGTDCGAGTSYSLLRTLNEAYKVVMSTESGRSEQLRLSALLGFYLATLGGAEALSLSDRIGSFRPGMEADFVVLDWAATPVLRRRVEVARDFEERLFALMILGDDRAVKATYVLGRRAYRRGAVPAGADR